MLKIFSKFIIVIVLFTSFQTSAQARRRANDGQILDRSIGQYNRYNTPRKAEKVDYVQITIDDLTEKLALDGFQNAILTKIMHDYNEKAISITEESIPNEAKMEQIKIEKNKMDVKITDMLTDKQKNAFTELKKSNREKKNDKKGKKKKSSEPEDSDNDLF